MEVINPTEFWKHEWQHPNEEIIISIIIPPRPPKNLQKQPHTHKKTHTKKRGDAMMRNQSRVFKKTFSTKEGIGDSRYRDVGTPRNNNPLSFSFFLSSFPPPLPPLFLLIKSNFFSVFHITVLVRFFVHVFFQRLLLHRECPRKTKHRWIGSEDPRMQVGQLLPDRYLALYVTPLFFSFGGYFVSFQTKVHSFTLRYQERIHEIQSISFKKPEKKI